MIWQLNLNFRISGTGLLRCESKVLGYETSYKVKPRRGTNRDDCARQVNYTPAFCNLGGWRYFKESKAYAGNFDLAFLSREPDQ